MPEHPVVTLTASTPEELREIAQAIDLARVDRPNVRHYEAEGRVVVRFAKEGGAWPELPTKQLARRTWLFTVHLVPFLRGALTIHHVVELGGFQDWRGALTGLDFDPRRRCVELDADYGMLSATVSALLVEAELSGEIAFLTRRRAVNYLPIHFDTDR